MMQYYLYKINDKPYCCWEYDMKKTNVEFLSTIDWEYFLFQTEFFEQALTTENKHKAALAIRNVYHHAMETFFSFLCATIQAPYCAFSWIFQAKTNDIRDVLRRLNSRDNDLHCAFNLKEISWEKFTNMIFFVNENEEPKIENQNELAEKFAELWETLAKRFLDDYSIKEYNAIKHGLRTSTGGFTLNIGPKGTLNNPERHNEWVSLGHSEFGSSFYVISQIKNDQLKDNPNYQSTRYNLNWDPKLMISVIKFLSISIGNLCNFLKFANGVLPENTPYYIPENNDIFDESWGFLQKQSNMNFSVDIKSDQIKPFSTREINSLIKQKKQTKPD